MTSTWTASLNYCFLMTLLIASDAFLAHSLVPHWVLQAVTCCFISIPCLPTTSSPRRWVRKSAFHLYLCSKWHCFKERQNWKAFTVFTLWKLATRSPTLAGLWLWNTAVHCYLDNRVSRAFIATVVDQHRDEHKEGSTSQCSTRLRQMD